MYVCVYLRMYTYTYLIFFRNLFDYENDPRTFVFPAE